MLYDPNEKPKDPPKHPFNVRLEPFEEIKQAVFFDK
jgi:hypothetical protein